MRNVFIAAACVAALAVLAGCGSQEEPTVAGEALVKVGDQVITKAMFDEELNKIPPFQRREMESAQGKRKFLDRMVEMELLYLAAVDEGMDKDEALAEEFERARRQILMRHYYRDRIENAAEPTEEEIASYYDEHLDEFSVKERVRGRLILAESEREAKKLLKRAQGGEDFAALAKAESADPPTATESGDLGWFTRDGYVRSLGVRPEITTTVFGLQVGEITEPIAVGDKGWAIVKLEEHEAARSKKLDEVRGDIARRITPKVRESFFREKVEELKARFQVEYVGEAFSSAATPEELFELAQGAKDPLERIAYYEEIVERFPEFEQADRALFMVGFVHSEELRDEAGARAAFQRFMDAYPESDLVKDARYMIDAMDGKEPEFELD